MSVCHILIDVISFMGSPNVYYSQKNKNQNTAK